MIELRCRLKKLSVKKVVSCRLSVIKLFFNDIRQRFLTVIQLMTTLFFTDNRQLKNSF